jgi:excisionase family DNA binding protein
METGYHGSEPEEDEEGGLGPAALPPPPEGLTVAEVAGTLGVSPTEVRRIIRTGQLPALRHVGLLGAEYRVRQEALDTFRAAGVTANAADPTTEAADVLDAAATEDRLHALEEQIAALHREIAGLHAQVAAGDRQIEAWTAQVLTEVRAELGSAADQRAEAHAEHAGPSSFGRAVRGLLHAVRSPRRSA